MNTINVTTVLQTGHKYWGFTYLFTTRMFVGEFGQF